MSTPIENADREIEGRNPVLGSSDELIVDYQSFPRQSSLVIGDSGTLEPLGGTHGKDFGTISFSEIEKLTELNVGQTSSDLVITGTGGDDQLYVRATGPDSGRISFRHKRQLWTHRAVHWNYVNDVQCG